MTPQEWLKELRDLADQIEANPGKYLCEMRFDRGLPPVTITGIKSCIGRNPKLYIEITFLPEIQMYPEMQKLPEAEEETNVR